MWNPKKIKNDDDCFWCLPTGGGWTLFLIFDRIFVVFSSFVIEFKRVPNWDFVWFVDWGVEDEEAEEMDDSDFKRRLKKTLIFYL